MTSFGAPQILASVGPMKSLEVALEYQSQASVGPMTSSGLAPT